MKPAVVVGSGFGGLAAAIRLRAMGHPVTVVEGRDQPGGRAGVFRRGGYTFDAGPTVITAPYLLEELFSLVGRRFEDYVDLVPVDPFYRIEFWDGSSFDYVGDEERLLEQIRRFNPKDVDGYRRMLKHIKDIFDVGYMELVDQPFDKVADMLRALPDMVRLRSFRSVYGMVRQYIQDERLRQVFTFQPLLIGGNPFKTTSIYTLIHWLERKWGVYFAKGGTGAIVSAMVQLLSELDVDVQTSSGVEHIDVNSEGRAQGVLLEGGKRIASDLIVANADPSMVYKHLLDSKVRKKHTDRRIDRLRQSMSLFVGYFGAKRTYEDIAHHTIILGPRYKGLLEDIFEKKRLAEDFSLYMHAPTRTDPGLAPPGHEGFYVLSPVPNNLSGIDWDKEGDAYFDRILESLEQRVLPGLRGQLTEKFFVTPRYFEESLRSKDGAAFGLEPTLTQSAYFRFHNRSEDVNGLYFVGAGTHPGGGVPGVLCSAKVLQKVVPKPERAISIPAPRRIAV